MDQPLTVPQAHLGELRCSPLLRRAESASLEATLQKREPPGTLVSSAPQGRTLPKLGQQPAYRVRPTPFLSLQVERTSQRVFLARMEPGPSRG